MGDIDNPRARAICLAEKSFDDCKRWPTRRLIDELEQIGYGLARNGKLREANSIFIVIADLTKFYNECK